MIELKNISLKYQNELLLDGVNCTFQSGKVSCILGKSGSGKTTILKLIAGLEENYSGDILFNSIPSSKLSPKDRKIGWVPQQQLLFPNKNVRQNVEFGMRLKKWGLQQINTQLAKVSKLTGIESILDRDVSRLSGGEKQRVALARALAPNPDLLLLDEPFSSLDAPERERFALIFREIQIETGITTIHVTHSPREAEIMGDYLHILANSKIEQSGSVLEVIHNPKSYEVARILNIPNVLPEGEFGNTKSIIVPKKAIRIDNEGIEVRIISITKSSVIVITPNKSTLEIELDTRSYQIGQKLIIQIDLSSCQEIDN